MCPGIENLQDDLRLSTPVCRVGLERYLDVRIRLAPHAPDLHLAVVFRRSRIEVGGAEEGLRRRPALQSEPLGIAHAGEAHITLAVVVARNGYRRHALPVRPYIGVMTGVVMQLHIGTETRLNGARVAAALIIVQSHEQSGISLALKHIGLR